LPNDSVQFLSLDEAIAIHEKLIDRFGGTPGIRDMGLLASALFRPQTGYFKDIAELAAALFESLLLNHAFVDGNKRAAFFVTDTFSRLTGWKLLVETNAAHSFIVGSLERSECNFETLLPWIRESITATR
jgi:death-on-curing protein